MLDIHLIYRYFTWNYLLNRMNVKALTRLFLILLIWANCRYANGQSATGNSPTVAKPGKTWAVVIGISGYKYIKKLNFADRDAQAFYDYLVDKDGGPQLPSSQVRLLLDDKAAAVDIYGALDWLKESAKPNDRIIFYFAGHGDEEKQTPEHSGFLLAYDCPKAAYSAYGTVSVNLLGEYFKQYVDGGKVMDILLIVDACRAGKLAAPTEGEQITMHALKQIPGNKIIKILSAQENETSVEGTAWGDRRGAFSYYLMKGIEGLANRNNDNVITTEELAAYLPLALAGATGGAQHPQIEDNPKQGLFVFNQELRKAAGQQTNTAITGLGNGLDNEPAPEIKQEYEKYLEYINNGRLLWVNFDTINCARHLYRQLINNPGALQIRASLKSSFKAALQRKAQENLDNYINWIKLDNSLVTSPGLNSSLYDAFQEITYLKKLMRPDDVLYNYVTARAYFMQSLNAVYKKDNTLAVGLLKKCLQVEPNAPFALNELGLHYKDLRMTDSSIYYFNKAILESPNWGLPYHNLGTQYHDLELYRKAIPIFEKAVEQDTTNAETYTNLGDSYYCLKNYEKAMLNFQKAIRVDPNHFSAYNDLGNVYSALNISDKAILNYQKALQLNDMDARVYRNLGHAYLNKQAYGPAIINYEKSATIEPFFASTYNTLGALYYLSDQYDKAISNYQKYLQFDPENANAYIDLASAFFHRLDYTKAIANYQKAISLDATNILAYRNLAALYSYIKNYRQAAVYLQKALNINPADPGLFNELGLAYHALKEYNKAIYNLQKALLLDQQQPDTYYNLACAFALQSDTANSLKYLNLAFEKGFKDYDHIMQDDDLISLRKLAAFDKLIKKYFAANR